MVNYIDYDKNDYSDDDFYYESKKDKVKRNKIKRNNYDEVEHKLKLKEKGYINNLNKLREYKNQI